LTREVEADESCFGGRREKQRKGSQGKARVEIVEEGSAGTLLRAPMKKVKRRSLIYTERFKS